MEGITRNSIFVVIVIVIFLLQIILVTFGGIAFGVYGDFGLTIQQWLICAAIGSISLIVNQLLKCIKVSDKPIIDEED